MRWELAEDDPVRVRELAAGLVGLPELRDLLPAESFACRAGRCECWRDC